MTDNVVFYFSGTGNCLKTAKVIAGEIGNGDIISMANPVNYDPAKQYDTVGFIFPVYFWGLPKKVIEFIKNAEFKNKNAYFYCVATCGNETGNTNYQLSELLKKNHGIKLNRGYKLKMFSNYIVMYNMKKNVEAITKKSDRDLVPIINSIKNRESKKIYPITIILSFLNNWFLKRVSMMDRNFNVSSDCNGCGICADICPVGNIEILDSFPKYKHNCEQCVACIQYCPRKAINYKNATQERRRYTNPDITCKELIERNKGVIG